MSFLYAMISLSLRVAIAAVLFAATATAQTSSLVGCGTRLAEAEFAYGEEIYEAAEALALDCAYTARATPTERARARRLLALTYLKADRPADARLMVVRLVSADSSYTAAPALDPPAYVALVASVQQQLHAPATDRAVASMGSVGREPERSEPRTSSPTRVDVNTADAEALDTVPGIGPALAGRIIAHREQNGPFRRVDDLQNVRGIGERSLERMMPYVTTGGGEVRVVPQPVVEAGSVVETSAAPRPRVNINTASAEELETLPRIGPALAQRIIAYRTDYGAFRSVDELELVRGIGPRTVEGFADLVTVE